MHPLRHSTIAVFAVASTLSSVASVTYSVRELSPRPNGTTSRAYAINDLGQVVGESSPGKIATFWSSSSAPTTIGLLPGAFESIAQDINDAGRVTGYAVQSGGNRLILRAFLWSPTSGLQELGTLPGIENTEGIAITPTANVYGTATSTSGSVGFEWDAVNGIRALSGNGTTTLLNAPGANRRGDVAGGAVVQGLGNRPYVLRSDGSIHIVPMLPGDGWGAARDVNDLGWVIGTSRLNAFGTSRGFLWTPETGVTPILYGTRQFNLTSVNNVGQVVGTTPESEAIVWDPIDGGRRLNDLLPGSGWQFLVAQDVNDRGEVVGWGVNPAGLLRGYVVSPHYTVSGDVWLNGLAASSRREGIVVQFTLANSVGVKTEFSAALSANGSWAAVVPVAPGDYTLYARSGGWLQQGVPVSVSAEGMTGAAHSLDAGDVNGDNVVDGLDLARLDASFNRASGEPGYDLLADLNRDSVVDGLDLAILDRSFNREGDPIP